jgi:hypothetical protein
MSLKRYLMDHRVPASERARSPLVASGGRVIWVAGLPAEPALPWEPLVSLELVPAAGADETWAAPLERPQADAP